MCHCHTICSQEENQKGLEAGQSDLEDLLDSPETEFCGGYGSLKCVLSVHLCEHVEGGSSRAAEVEGEGIHPLKVCVA